MKTKSEAGRIDRRMATPHYQLKKECERMYLHLGTGIVVGAWIGVILTLLFIDCTGGM